MYDHLTTIIQNLSASFPSHTFELGKKLDLFTPVYALTVDGKKTTIRIRAEVADDVFTAFYGFDAPMTEEKMKEVYKEVNSIYTDEVKKYFAENEKKGSNDKSSKD